ncbi:hypothetical protein [Reichenbachiella sp.]|uniref:hypothetical protein n=1 Tax=Reichenbachiella sp. TaxID=2184521 RepID=UPI003B5B53DF
MKFLKRNFLWIIYFVFVLLVILNHEGEPVFMSEGPYPLGKYLIWAIYLSFLSYSLYCSSQENFFSTLRKLYPLHWARQIGLDLYLGLMLSLGVIYLNEGSVLVVLIWLIPVLIYANLAILLYVALNYDSIIAHFLKI